MLPAKELREVQKMRPAQRDKYFERYARYFDQGTMRRRYGIRVGLKTLLSGDTMDLRSQFDALVGK